MINFLIRFYPICNLEIDGRFSHSGTPAVLLWGLYGKMLNFKAAFFKGFGSSRCI